MSIRNIVLASVLTAASAGVFAQAKEQFFPSLAYRDHRQIAQSRRSFSRWAAGTVKHSPTDHCTTRIASASFYPA